MPVYLNQGEYKEALEQIVAVLGDCEHGEWNCGNNCQGCQYEMQEASRTARAALGLPVPRQRCKECGTLDRIYWHIDDPNERGVMSCHNCGAIETETNTEWVEEPADVRDTNPD